MKNFPYAFYVALDGNGINGIEGHGGVCVFWFNPENNDYEFKIKYYDGIASGHAVSVNPGKTVGFLGNFGQHLHFYDPNTLEEIDRISTLRFEPNDTTIRGTTHLVWMNDQEFITAIGDFFYKFDLNDLKNPEKLGPHKVKIPHAMKMSKSGKYICYGSIDHPKRGEAKEVGVWDMETGEATRIELPATCWHLVQHPTEDLFYPVSYRVLPTENNDYHQWAIAFFKEYAFEISGPEKRPLRHWMASRETPAHLSSDVTISRKELIYCAAGSHTIVCIDLDNFSDFRLIEQKPSLKTRVRASRQIGTQVYESLARGSLFSGMHHVFSAIRVSRFTFVDATYATQISKDETLLFTASRGLNRVVVYDYPSNERRLVANMPDLQKYFPKQHPLADPRLGFHHGHLVSPN